jgi:hypothetical protein
MDPADTKTFRGPITRTRVCGNDGKGNIFWWGSVNIAPYFGFFGLFVPVPLPAGVPPFSTPLRIAS